MNKTVTKQMNLKIPFKLLGVMLKYLIYPALSFEIFFVTSGNDNGDGISL